MTFEKSNSRIAKNTLMLYCRMFLTMAVGLYTSRVVLNALGVTDYGVYNVVGGVVAMLGFFNSSILTSTQRFLNVGMSDNSTSSLRTIFSTSINVHLIIGIITVVLLETAGLWLVMHKLVVPEGKETAVMWVYQCSILSFFISIISAPYSAAIVAYERMSVFAVMSIIEVTLKLVVAIVIMIYPDGKLILYAVLLLVTTLIMRILYGVYCSRAFTEIQYSREWNIKLIKEMMSFSGWMIFGCVTDMLSTQGVNLLINIFFGPIFNAARAIAVQVQAAVAQFSSNFLISVNPQIVKSYASRDYSYSYRLVFTASKVSFFLMMVLIVPIIIRSEQILAIWLKIVPQDAAIFLNLILIEYLIRSSYTPIAQINQASGNIRLYQISIAVLFLLNFIITYILFRLKFPASSTFVVSAIIAVLGLIVRLAVLKFQQNFPVSRYLKEVSMPVFLLAIVSFIVCYVIDQFTSPYLWGMMLTIVLSFIVNCSLIWIVGLDKQEKVFVQERALALRKRLFYK